MIRKYFLSHQSDLMVQHCHMIELKKVNMATLDDVNLN